MCSADRKIGLFLSVLKSRSSSAIGLRNSLPKLCSFSTSILLREQVLEVARFLSSGICGYAHFARYKQGGRLKFCHSEKRVLARFLLQLGYRVSVKFAQKCG